MKTIVCIFIISLFVGCNLTQTIESKQTPLLHTRASSVQYSMLENINLAELGIIKPSKIVPLLINNVRSSCDCTSVKWDKHPIKPGETGEIRIVFKPNSLGTFLKTIEVYCNTLERVVNLKLRGTVKES